MKRITKITLLTALLFVSVSSLPTAVAKKPVQFGFKLGLTSPLNTISPISTAGVLVNIGLPERVQFLRNTLLMSLGAYVGYGFDSTNLVSGSNQHAVRVNAQLGLEFVGDGKWKQLLPKLIYQPGVDLTLGKQKYFPWRLGEVVLAWPVNERCTFEATVGYDTRGGLSSPAPAAAAADAKPAAAADAKPDAAADAKPDAAAAAAQPDAPAAAQPDAAAAAKTDAAAAAKTDAPASTWFSKLRMGLGVTIRF